MTTFPTTGGTVTHWLVETIKQHYGSRGPGFGKELIAESAAQGKLLPGRFSIRQAAQAAFGPAWESRLARWSALREWTRESTDAIDSSAFREVTGAILVNAVEKGYSQAASIASELCGVYETPDNPLDEATIAFAARSTDKPGVVAQGMDYPITGLAPWSIKAPRPEKFGQICQVTLEAVKADRTGDLLDAAAEVGRSVGTMEAEDKLSVVLGITNNYVRDGVASDTYATSGTRINAIDDLDLSAGPKSIDRLLQLFANQVDPLTGKNVNVAPTALFVTPALGFQARAAMRPTEYRQTFGATVSVSGNPLGVDLPVLVDVHARRLLVASGVTGAVADTYAILGDFPRAFRWRQVEPFSVFEADPQSGPGFYQDVVYAVKARSWGKAFVFDPLRVARGRKTS